MRKQMRHPLTTSFLMLVLALSTGAQQRKLDREHDQLVGPVKTVRIEKAKLSNKGGKLVEGRRVRTQIWTYDKKGSLINETIGSSHHLYSYDSKGNRLEKRNARIIMGGPPAPIDFSNQVRANDGSVLYKWAPKYDAQGNRIEEAISLGDRAFLHKYVYTYDSNGHRIEVGLYGTKGSLTNRWVYSYDDNGSIKEQIEYEGGRSGTSKRTYDYEFDSAGNWIKATTSKLITKKGKSNVEPAEVSYRIITYY